MSNRKCLVTTVVALATAGWGLALPAANAAGGGATLYVSPSGTSSNGDLSCTDAGYSKIQDAVIAAPAGGTVIVCPGTYHEGVTITTSLTLRGQSGAVIDATGQPYGVGIAYSGDTVEGLTVENATANSATSAPGDGIATVGIVAGVPTPSNGDVIIGNVTKNNDGSGIDLDSTSDSTAANNVAVNNGVGINLSNDFGPPAAHNVVVGNVANRNPGGCGIVLADHSGSGVFSNRIRGNTADDNGLGTPSRPNASSGSGIILAAAGTKGGVFDNAVRDNEMSGNGHGGVAMHIHVPGPKFTGNSVTGNTIGKNNVRTDYKDKKSTGIYLGSTESLTISIRHNLFRDEAYGVFTAGHVRVKGLGSNGFAHSVKRHIRRIKTYAG